MPPASDIGLGKQLLANSMNASNAAYAPSDLLSVPFLKSLAFSFLVPTQWQPWATFRLRGFSGLYHTFDYSGKI